MRYENFFMLILFSLLAFVSPDQQVSGYVTDEWSRPIKGAMVRIKESAINSATLPRRDPPNRKTITDQNGSFSLALKKDEAAILIITAQGYDDKEIFAVPGKMTIKLKTSAQAAASKAAKDHSQAILEAEYGRGKHGYIGQQAVPNTALKRFQQVDDGFNREGYDYIRENGFRSVRQDPLSTFSIDVDGASYSNIRRFLNSNTLPPAGAVRVEEMINYFQYGYEQPKNKDPFAVHTEMATCPWNSKNKLMLIGLQGRKISTENLPPSNLTFLIDVSGSMSSADKLPLVKSALGLLTDQLREEDMISIVVYAGAAGLVLPPVSGSDKAKIRSALDALSAGGSTAGGAGIKLAYQTARQNFRKNGNNRVVLCTDGDFNVGMSSDDEMERLIEKERNGGVFLTVLGFGTGNYQDAKMQKLANKGNGNHAYIDQLGEAKKVFVKEFGGTLFTIAKDVKLQLEFNPAYVKAYRLVGYENRMLQKEDFNDDQKDAGELGSGHTVTALYEIVPAGGESGLIGEVDDLKYQNKANGTLNYNKELMTLKLRYKMPEGENSMLMVKTVKDNSLPWKASSDQFRFAAAVAELGMLLRDSEFKGSSSFSQVISIASSALTNDLEGYRKEFVQLAEKAALLKSGSATKDLSNYPKRQLQ